MACKHNVGASDQKLAVDNFYEKHLKAGRQLRPESKNKKKALTIAMDVHENEGWAVEEGGVMRRRYPCTTTSART